VGLGRIQHTGPVRRLHRPPLGSIIKRFETSPGKALARMSLMTRTRTAALCLLAPAVFCLAAFAAATPDTTAGEPVPVFVSILPQKYLVEQVGGPHVAVEVLVPPGQSPETYEPTPRQMAALASARLFLRAGMPFEDALFRRGASALRGVQVADALEGVPLMVLPGHAHGHGQDGHAHAARGQDGREGGEGLPDPHVWLDPRRVKIQAGTICEALCRIDPERAGAYRQGRDRLRGDLDRLHARVSAVLAPFQGRRFYVFHPAFGYFADAYGLVQVPLEGEGKEPGPRRLAGLIDLARRDGARVLFVEPQQSSREARTFADAVGARIVPLDPLAEDYPENLERMAETLAGALEEETKGGGG